MENNKKFMNGLKIWINFEIIGEIFRVLKHFALQSKFRPIFCKIYVSIEKSVGLILNKVVILEICSSEFSLNYFKTLLILSDNFSNSVFSEVVAVSLKLFHFFFFFNQTYSCFRNIQTNMYFHKKFQKFIRVKCS